MQVSSWIAARVAVLVEFAVFLISSTITHKRLIWMKYQVRRYFF